ncbi:sodium- and chloride-dependent glycine transporter 1 [Drosophila novamexicana]|uniref:sodium- and chloride-dependent glycine transporter 1 n=1 Tax=Drosophila novamexicana TaxID=47314 RepID=UPI0011E5D15E|nr:sodium- and chloride-dependent glycine transporter 1 [Drosophila novamexicana]
MVYETSYESGRRPFKPDLARGKWEKPTDFIYACFGLALKLDLFIVSYWFYFDMGLFGMLPYYIYMAIYLVPILVIHSFMGQFSSSGFISAFRVSPFFKGMGYVSLALSLTSMLFYGIFAIVPLIFIMHSLRPTLPWSCEGFKSEENVSTICNMTDTQVQTVLSSENESDIYEMTVVHVPSVLFFRQHFETLRSDSYMGESNDYELSWQIAGLSVVIWAIITFIFLKFSETAKFGKLLRCMILSTLALLLVCLVRFLFLPGALDGITHYVKPRMDSMVEGGLSMTIIVLQAFGSGWGSIMALSSFNNFKTNIMSYSWIIAFGQTLVYILFGLVTFMLDHYFETMKSSSFSMYVEVNWAVYLSSASALSTLEVPNLWTIIYYTMLLMASIIVMITQLFTVFTSLFDEFELLRHYKQQVIVGVLCFLASASIFFCTNHGVLYFSALSLDAIMIHSVMHLLLLLAVLWVYGRERFQRDIEFMIGQPFASWKIFILRFIAPLFLLYTLLLGVFISSMEHAFSSSVMLHISLILVLVPMLFIPGYGVFIMCQNTGGFCDRFRRACRPNDWYPTEMEDRQQYEEVVGNADITHQLYEVTEEVN